jgi:hypothetical protein
VKSKNGTYIESFEWSTPEAVAAVHHHPEVGKVWEAMGGPMKTPAAASRRIHCTMNDGVYEKTGCLSTGRGLG